MENLIKSILKVMESCENIDKNLTVGAGTSSSYKGVADKDVKLIINRSMRENGLVIFPIKIEPKVTVERWEEKTNYGLKQKQSVFTEVLTTYKLMHTSGESMDIQGYGHGVDSQDKSAGKATTYALKYALLYQFLVATGNIDDSDNTHSKDIKEPIKEVIATPIKTPVKTTQVIKQDWITEEQFEKAKDFTTEQIELVFKKFKFRDKAQQEELQEIYNNLKSK